VFVLYGYRTKHAIESSQQGVKKMDILPTLSREQMAEFRGAMRNYILMLHTEQKKDKMRNVI
jgi:hypothetical protein